MRSLLMIISFIVLLACKNTSKEEIAYVQQGDVQLVNPRIKTQNMIIDSISWLTASLAMDEAKIYYTKDGSMPAETSTKYKDTVLVSEPGTYIFKAFRPGFIASETEEVSFYNKGIDVADISFSTSLNEQYKGEGKKTLVNHKKGTLNFRDGQWIGVTEPLEVIVTFKNKELLESVDIGYLTHTTAWIFPVEHISVSISEDGINFTDFDTSMTFEKSEAHISKLENIHIPISKKVKKIKIKVSNTSHIPEWHEGKGNPAWLFMDEWVFNTKNN